MSPAHMIVGHMWLLTSIAMPIEQLSFWARGCMVFVGFGMILISRWAGDRA